MELLQKKKSSLGDVKGKREIEREERNPVVKLDLVSEIYRKMPTCEVKQPSLCILPLLSSKI